MLKLFLWLRYLRGGKIAYLSVAAVALSVSLLVAVASLFTGFVNAFEQSAVETMGDVVITAPMKFAKYPLFLEQLEQTNAVQAATAILSAEGLLHLGKGNVRAVNIWGIEAGRRAKVTDYKRFLLKQKDAPGEPSFEISPSDSQSQSNIGGGFVGIAVVDEPNEKTDEYDQEAVKAMLGQQVVLTTGTVSQERVKSRAVKFTITDIVFTGVYDLDKRFIYLPIEDLQKKIFPEETEPVANQIQIKLADNTEAEAALAQIRGVWQNFARKELGWSPYFIMCTDIETAKQLQSRYVAELLKQMSVLLLTFGIVSFSVIVLVFCIFHMIVMTRRKDIAIIKSCGAASSSVTFIFVEFGAFIGLVGSGIGVVLGFIFTKNVNTIEHWITTASGLKVWKSSVYMFSRIPNEVNWVWALVIVLLAISAAAIGALIPALIAARTKPVEILRYE